MNILNKIGLVASAMMPRNSSAQMDSYALELAVSSNEAVGDDPNCIQTLTDSGTIKAFYDPNTELVNIVAEIKDGSFAGWGWGSEMKDTEMIIFVANGDDSTVDYYYSIGYSKP